MEEATCHNSCWLTKAKFRLDKLTCGKSQCERNEVKEIKMEKIARTANILSIPLNFVFSYKHIKNNDRKIRDENKIAEKIYKCKWQVQKKTQIKSPNPNLQINFEL